MLFRSGLIDFLNDYITLAKTTGNQAKIAANIPNYKEYIFQAIPEMEGTGKVDILSAGKFDEHYIQKVNDFDWEGFKERYNGIGFIEEYWKPQLQNGDYDYIFIDSRTGISDYAGICNILMPDANVILVAPNKQNMQGAKRIAEGIVSSGYVQKGKRKPLILPLLARVDTSVESSAPKLRSYKELFAETFFPLIFPNKEFTEKAKNDYLKWNETYILEYKRDLSVGENILFDLNKQTIEVSSLANIYKEIATLIQRTDHNSDNFIS